MMLLKKRVYPASIIFTYTINATGTVGLSLSSLSLNHLTEVNGICDVYPLWI